MISSNPTHTRKPFFPHNEKPIIFFFFKDAAFHEAKEKHLPVMKDYEHQVQKFLNGCMDKTTILPPCKYGHFCQLRLVRIRPTLNQTWRCNAVRSYLF